MAEFIYGSTNGGNSEPIPNGGIDTQRITELEGQIAELDRQRAQLESEMKDLGFLDQARKRELAGEIMALEEKIDARQMSIKKLKE
ncbi:hypothetical protein AUK14_02445 [Candidatus Berkelbacteria bacterium CG2_30_39_44]|nr:MAG: hypothetical protein AUK14_02445 [Candidatus Berkelbacteria bacterium CG2_30_39_44]PIX30646.1 MAG: hypothetical protein COZ62_01550 [Candidatus Berkelbacteria bacterium CG_4_8_14_3_um_filter_39_27]